MLEKHNVVNVYTSKYALRFGDNKVRFVDYVKENVGSREQSKNNE